jgi:predicted Zn-dependent peptidase
MASVTRADECPTLDVDAVMERVAPRIDSYRLANGLRVHLVPRPDDRTVSVRVAYDVGARDEPPERSGMAHLFEHVMFKGSRHVPDGGHFRIVKAVGGRVNATTDYDTTQYWSTVPSDALSRVLFAEADRMQGLRVTARNLDNQRAAIREEGLGLENMPYVAAAADFGVRLWRGTPYGHSPIGTPEELAATTEEEARRFHATYYTPANAHLVVAGGFEVERTRTDVERFFGGLPHGPERPLRASVRVDRSPQRVVARDPLAPLPLYAVVWHTVGVRADDALAVAVLDDLLMGHANARLRRRIADRLTLDAYGLPVVFRDVGLLNYVFAPRLAVDVETLRRAVHEQVQALRRDGPDAEEVCRSRRHEQRERLELLASNEGLAAAVVRGAVLQGDPSAFASELRALEAVDGARVHAAAQRYLSPDPSTLEIRPTGFLRFMKALLEMLPASVGDSLEASLL